MLFKHCNGTHINRSQSFIQNHDIIIRLVLVNKSLFAQSTFSSMTVKKCLFTNCSLKRLLRLKLNLNKTEIKQICFSFISDALTCEI